MRVAKPGSWVVLHDINLPMVAPRSPAWGAKWLFDAWPFASVRATGPAANIGAVELPHDPSTLVPMALSLLDRRWEHLPTMWHVALPGALQPVEDRVREYLEAVPAEA
jgi:hypothetical protein